MKKGVKRKKTSKIRRHKVVRRTKQTKKHSPMKTLAIVLVSAIALVLVVGLVGKMTGYNVFDTIFGGDAEGIYSDWLSGKGVNENVGKILIAAIVGILVFSVLAQIPGLSGPQLAPVRIILAVIVGFLGTAYIIPEELFAILTSYSALGFALGAGFPFVVLLYFSLSIAKPTGGQENAFQNIVKKIVGVGLWVLFAVFIFIRILGIKSVGEAVSSYTTTALWILLIASLALAVAFPLVIWRRLRNAINNQIVENMKINTELATQKKLIEANAARREGGG